MQKFNVWIPGSGCSIGAEISVFDNYKVEFGGWDEVIADNLIYNWQNKTVQPPNSTEVIGKIDRFFEISYPEGWWSGSQEILNLKELLNKSVNNNNDSKYNK